MKWGRYLIFALLIISGFVYIKILNDKMLVENRTVFEISNSYSEVLVKKTRIEETLTFQKHVSDEIMRERISLIIKEIILINSEKINALSEYKQTFANILKNLESNSIDEKHIRDVLTDYSGKLRLHRKSLIDNVKKLKKQRDILVLCCLFIFISALLIEMVLITKVNKRVRKYLRNFALKNYDFNIKQSNVPYFDPAISEMKKLKGNLRILDEAINVTLKGYSVKDTLKELFQNEKFKNYLNFDRIGFASIDNGQIIASVGYSNSEIIKLKKGFKIQVNDSESLQKIINSGDARIISDLEEYYNKNPKSKSTGLLIDEGYKSSLTAPIYNKKNEVVGFLFFSSKKKDAFSENDKLKISSITDILSYIFSKNMLIDDLTSNTSLAFVKLVEGKDPETVNHLERMSLYTRIIAEELSENKKYKEYLDYHKIEDIYRFAPLHDIGKVGIPDNILLKPGRLSSDEFEVMKKHADIGAQVLINFEENLQKYDSDFFKTGIKIAKHHHEKWDGTGYPEGLKQKEIPLEARIVSVADVFDALTSKRIYKEAMSFEKSIDLVKSMSGENFDPEIVNAFEKSLPRISEVYNRLKEV